MKIKEIIEIEIIEKNIIINIKRFIRNIMFVNVIWSFDNISKGNYKIIINVRIDK